MGPERPQEPRRATFMETPMTHPSPCRSGCPTRDCGSYAKCLRAASVKVTYANSASGRDYSKQKRWDAELAAYRSTVAEGIQPRSTTMVEIDKAKRFSDMTGQAFTG